MTADDPTPPPSSPLCAWAGFWETLCPASIPQAQDLCAPDMRFVDPFNDLTGVDEFRRMLEHMFAHVEAAHFVVRDKAMGTNLGNGTTGYLRWVFTAKIAGRAVAIEGMSEIAFGPDGRVRLHRDHWDAGAQVYGRVPVLGAILRIVRKRLALPPR